MPERHTEGRKLCQFLSGAKTRWTDPAAHSHEGAFGHGSTWVRGAAVATDPTGLPRERQHSWHLWPSWGHRSCSHAFKMSIKGFRAELNLGNSLYEIFSLFWFPLHLNHWPTGSWWCPFQMTPPATMTVPACGHPLCTLHTWSPLTQWHFKDCTHLIFR